MQFRFTEFGIVYIVITKSSAKGPTNILTPRTQCLRSFLLVYCCTIMWSDPSSTNMAYGNQWMNPAHYKNMTNEQVDWASLAQQWIKMKETTPVIPPVQQGKPTSCEPNLLGGYNHPMDSQSTSNMMMPNKTLGDRNIAPGPVLGNNIEKPSAWNTWTWQQQQQWNWNWASTSTPPPSKPPIVESINPIRPPYVAPPLLTEPPPSFPIIPSNKQFPANNYWQGPNTRIPPPVESDQWNKPNVLSTVDDRNQDASYIDAAKRKQLPAWIREGLEKMEREKRRKMEHEQSFDKPEYSNFKNENVPQDIHNSPNTFDQEVQMVDDDVEHDSDYINETEPKKTEFAKNDPPLLIPRKTKAQIWEDTMLNLRRILTKLLMEVTNDMMLSVVKDVLKTTLQSDLQRTQSHTSLAGKLGLGVYGSDSESSDESDEEPHKSGYKQSLKQDSDETIQERILKRKREFSNIEVRILMELDQLEDREKRVRSKFDNSIKLSGDLNDNGSQVVENIQAKGRIEDDESKLDKGHEKPKKELSNDSNSKNGQKKKKSKSKRSSSSSDSSSSSESKKSDDTDNKYSYKKNDRNKSKSSNKRNKSSVLKRKKRSRSRNRSRSHSRSKRSRSRSRHRSNSRSRHYDRRSSPHSYRSRRSRSPVSRHGSSRKYKSKRNSSSSSNESRTTKHRYRR